MNRRHPPWLVVLSSLCSLCLCGSSAIAHPIANTNHDRIIKISLARDGVAVDYSLEVAPDTAAKELTRAEIAQLTTGDFEEFYRIYLKHQKTALARNLDAKLDATPLNFTCVESSYDVSTNIYTFRFKALWELEAGQPHHFTFNDANYALDDFSVMRLTLTADDSVRLDNFVAPTEALMDKKGTERGPGEGDLLRQASADVRVPDRNAAAAPTAVAPANGPTPTAGPQRPTAAEEPHADSLFKLLLDTRQGLAILLLLAAGFGAVHALTPGHGKTLVAAYLVGERGTVGHAILLGVTTTLTHTAAVLIVAGLLPLFFPKALPAEVQRIFELTGGVLVAGLGLFLLSRRLTGGHDHFHIGGHHHHHGHDHDHAHDHDHDHFHDHDHVHTHGVTTEAPPQKVGWGRLIVLGVSGGIVPCWDAIAMLGLAISAGRLWLGLPLLVAFSAGLAGVLTAIGVSVVYASRFAGKRWGGTDRLRPLIRALPLLSAAFITLMGLWLCYASFHS
ncbi:MAG TPA: hypothetical protein VMS17_15085 [Gemmataceae bacterium]|nr:hypothetical protein [Gemmataceae bacterium]